MFLAMRNARHTTTKSLGRRLSAGALHPPTRLSSTLTSPRPTSLTVVPPKPIPDSYSARTYNPTDPDAIQLKLDNATRLSDDTRTFRNRSLSSPTGLLRGTRRHQLEQAGVEHILSRHFPQYFAFNFKAQNTFFPKSTTMPQLIAMIILVYRNGTLLRQSGRFTQLVGEVDGTEYVLGLNGAKVGQFYPRTSPAGGGTTTAQELRTRLPSDGSVIHVPPTDPST